MPQAWRAWGGAPGSFSPPLRGYRLGLHNRSFAFTLAMVIPVGTASGTPWTYWFLCLSRSGGRSGR